MKKIAFLIVAFIAFFAASAQHRSTFDDLGLYPDSYWNGSNLSGGFTDGDAFFPNQYNAINNSWTGFAYSNVPVNVDTIVCPNGCPLPAGFSGDTNYKYSSAEGSGVYGSGAFGICSTGHNYAALNLVGFAPGHQVYGFYVTNSAYDYLSMKYGDSVAKKFGGVAGTDPDWFLLTVTGWYEGSPIADSVNFYLADFRSSDSTQHYILNSWQFVNLLALGNVDSLAFILSSSDTGINGMNTPAYFDLDNFMTTDGATYSPPAAVNDSFFVEYLDTLTGNTDTLIANIVANDTLSPFLMNTVSLISSPLIIGAYAYLDSADSLVYIPAAGVQSTDTLYYSVCDEVGSCDTGQIVIVIHGPDDTGIPGIGLSDLHMYPNPASTYILVSYPSALLSVNIIDVSGREVMQENVNSPTASLNISALSAGAYTVLVHTSDGSVARRFIKE